MLPIFWLGWALLVLAVSVAVFGWSVYTRQFDEGRRAALLPFDDLAPCAPQLGSRGRLHLWLLIAVASLGFAAVVGTAVLAWWWR